MASTKKYQKVKFSFLIKPCTTSIEACSINFKIYLTDMLFQPAVLEFGIQFSIYCVVSYANFFLVADKILSYVFTI